MQNSDLNHANSNSNLSLNSTINSEILAEAADWLTHLQSCEFTEQDHTKLKQWQQQSTMHQAAWQRAESVLGTFNKVPALLGRNTLSQADNISRRHALKTFALVLMTTPALYLTYQQKPWQEWQADLRTNTGERLSKTLSDGTRIVLNTNTSLNIAFSATERRITLLEGEILITTGNESINEVLTNKNSSQTHTTKRPFIVSTSQGNMRALGTRFSVRQLKGDRENLTQLSVFESAVEITPANTQNKVVVQSGEQRLFSNTNIQAAQPINEDALLWEKGMLLAKNMPLGELVNELSRYRSGILRCDAKVANIIVSGAFNINNPQVSLDLLEKTLPIKISGITHWWLTVKAK